MKLRPILFALAAIVLVALAPGAARAQTALGFQQITSLGSATTLTVPAGTRWAWICAETAAVRWRDDGTNPTGSVGMPIAAGGCIQYLLPPGALVFIQQASSAVLDVSYYK